MSKSLNFSCSTLRLLPVQSGERAKWTESKKGNFCDQVQDFASTGFFMPGSAVHKSNDAEGGEVERELCFF